MMKFMMAKMSIFLAIGVGLASLISFSLINVNAQPENTTSTYSVSISKDSTSGLIITDGASYVSGFDTTYTIEGKKYDFEQARDLVVSSIAEDFANSPTIGYIKVAESNSSSSNATGLANPFASKEQIHEKINSVLNDAIDSIFNENDVTFTIGPVTEVIKCTFGDTLETFKCSKVGGFKFF